ncbi:MAG: ATP-binding protein [Bacteroidales bacterium]|nr:ATP-binding protein [Bacteroidales bacterium]
MDTPFIYNKPVTGRYFVGRKTEVTILTNLLREGENVVMYEPPKAGKDSVLQQVFFNMKLSSSQFRIANVSLLSVRTIADLCSLVGTEVLRLYGVTPQDFAALVPECLPGTHFVFDEQVFQATGRILSLNWDIDDDDIRALFRLPFILARKDGRKLFVCVDDFQNVLLTEDGERVCNLMQEVFKARTPEDRAAACYVLYGSRVNAMKEIFEHRRFFHRQVERLELQDIDPKDIADSVNRGFLSSGKVVDRALMMGVCNLFKNNVYYVNCFAAICDSLSKGYMTEPVLVEALSQLLAIHAPAFRAAMEDLTTFQVCLLRAVVDGHTKFSSSEVIHKYGLNSSANVRRLKDALCKKEILTFDGEDNPRFLDPLFEYWVTKYYFEVK